MDPFTIALATFGVQKLRGKSTGRALRDAALLATGSQLLGATEFGQGLGLQSFGSGAGQLSSLSQTGIGSLFAGQSPALATAAENQALLAANQPLTPELIAQNKAMLLESGYDLGDAGGLTYSAPTMPQAKPNWFMENIVGKSAVPEQTVLKDSAGNVLREAAVAQPGSGFLGLSPGAKIGLGIGTLTAASSLLPEEKMKPLPGTTPEEIAAAKAEADKQVGGMTANVGTMPRYSGSPYNYASNYYRFNQGGIVDALPRFNTGGINYMPSKQTHDENDVHNYVRAEGYVEDGSGNGDKDEDTILAQLADGEFVSRADAILGAGIMEGASPSSMKDMRKKGAAFFYDQQAKFKRVYDLLNASRKDN